MGGTHTLHLIEGSEGMRVAFARSNFAEGNGGVRMALKHSNFAGGNGGMWVACMSSA